MMRERIAYTCSYVPLEIIMASGFTPRRIMPEDRPVDAESHVHANTCCYVKSLLAGALRGDLTGMRGIVFINNCDGMRRLHDLWNAYVKDPPPVFLDIPKKKDEPSIAFFAAELKRLALAMETVFHGQTVTGRRLNDAIRECNRARLLMAEVFTLNEIHGTDLFSLCLTASQTPPELLEETIRGYRTRASKGGNGAKRLILTGNILARPDLIQLIEECGAEVAALDICIGARHYDGLVEEDTDEPFKALAQRYLTRTACARMMGFEEQFSHLKELHGRHSAHGILCSNVKYCDPLLYNLPLIEQRLRDQGIPFLALENDYTWEDLSQVRTRVETFIAMQSEVGHV